MRCVSLHLGVAVAAEHRSAHVATRRTREHFRVTFDTVKSGTWTRCSKDAFVAKMNDGRRGTGLGCVGPEPGTGAGLFLSLLNSRGLRHVRRRRVGGRGWRLLL